MPSLWNKLSIRRYSITINDKTYIDADALIEWLDRRIEPHVVKSWLEDENQNIIEECKDYIGPQARQYADCRDRVQNMVKGIRLRDGLEE